MIYKDYIQKHAAEAPREAVCSGKGAGTKGNHLGSGFSATSTLWGPLVAGHPGARIDTGENSHQWALIHMTAVLEAGAGCAFGPGSWEIPRPPDREPRNAAWSFTPLSTARKPGGWRRCLTKTRFICWDEEEFDKMLSWVTQNRSR